MAKRIEVQIVGDASNLQRALGTATDGTSKFGSALGTLAKTGALAAGAAGIGAVAITLRQGIKEYTESAKVAAQTNAVLKSTGEIANVTAKDVNKLAESLMRKSGVDDEAIKSGENMLLTFKNVRNEVGQGNAIFDRSTKAILDMDTAMTRGNVTAESLAASSIRVGKALNDPIAGLTALTRVGVQFTDAQKASIKAMVESGNVMGAQKIILKELESQFGGSAETIGNTLPKQLNVLKESFNNFAGDLIAKAIPSVQRFVDWLNTNLVPAEGFTAKLKVVWEGLTDVGKELWDAIVTAWEGEDTKLFIDAEKRLEITHTEGLGEKLKTALKEQFAAIDWSDVLLTVGIGIGKGVLQLQVMIWQFLFNAWKTAWSLLLSAAGAAASQLAEWVGKGLSNLAGVFSTAFNAVKTVVVGVFDAIKNVAATAISFVIGLFDKFLGALQAVFEAAGRIPGIGRAFDAVAEAIGRARGKVQGLQDAIDGLKDKTVTLTVVQRNIKIGEDFHHRAAGGPVSSRQTYIVGEHGPELFTPNTSGRITANSALTSRSALAGSGGINVYIAAPIGSEQDLQNMVVSALAKVNARGGIA